MFIIFFFQQDAAKEENMRNEAQQQKEDIQAKQVSFENESKTLKNHFLLFFKNTNHAYVFEKFAAFLSKRLYILKRQYSFIEMQLA
jgi:hypothetical protein